MEYVSFLHVWYRRALNPVLVACIASLALGLLLFPRIEGTFIRRNVDESTATLRVVADGINQLTQRYEPVPELIAERPLLVQVLKDPGNSGLVPYVNEQLRLTAQAIDASDIFLLDPTGLTVAASNYRRAHSFIGNRFDYRPYFQEAVSGRSSQFHALGTTSGERGFFFAAPVLDGVTVRGVLAVKVQVNDIEMGWDGLTKDIAIADPNGVIFLSNREDLHFRTLAPLSEEVLQAMEATRQFPLNLIQPLPTQADVIDDDAVSIEFTTNDGKESFLVESYPLAKPGWHAIALSPYAPVRTNALYVLLVWCLIVLVLSLAAMVFQQRRARFKERMEIQRRERDLLEQRVQDRTAELNKANRELQIEIEERKATEESLRRKKNELIQAGKLAALGQMSAAISHEINQPLSAVLSYADNAAAYLDRGRADEARKNITHISDMADRMARISKHLRNFARRPGDQLSSVEICSVIDEAISLSEPQLKRRNAVVRFERPGDQFAIGGHLRLQQVLINLFSNALDAMESETEPQIVIEVECRDDQVIISVRDYGPGLPDDLAEQAFEPFVSTKENGSGLGLGLSISYNIIEDFGGKLTAHNHPSGGAVFCVELRAAQPHHMAGE